MKHTVTNNFFQAMRSKKSREMKGLVNYNSVGAKETVIQQTQDGTMIGGTRKDPPVYPPSPTDLEAKRKSVAEVTPEKKKKSKKMPTIARGKGQLFRSTINDVILSTESLGPDGEFIVLTGSKQNKTNVFLKPILDTIERPHTNGHGNKLVDVFDCRLSNARALYLRKSHEENEKIPLKNKPGLFEIGIVASTKKDNFEHELDLDPLYLEKLFKNECEKILKSYETNQGGRKKAVEYEFVSLTKTGWRPLDHVLLDETVGHVLCVYFLDQGERSNGIYEKLKEFDIHDLFFSKHSKTNKYCAIAVKDFGYPEY